MAFFRCGWQGVFYNKAVKTAKASIASFVNKTGANLALKGLTCYINPTQSGSGDPAPDNVRPISGVSEVNLNNSGENTYTTTGIWAVASATITVISTDAFRIQRASNWSSTKQPNANIGLEVGKTYCLVCDVEYTSGTAYIAIRNSANAIQSGTGKILESKKVYFYFTLANATDFLSFFCSYNESVGDVTYRNIRLYEIKTTYNLSLDGTRYGGTIDVVRGKLRAINAYEYLDGSEDESWVLITSVTHPYLSHGALDCKELTSLGVPLTCNMFPHVSITNTNDLIGADIVWRSLRIRMETMPVDISAWRTWLSNNPIQLVYELATPIEIDLTPTQINSLLGQNHIWHNGNGDIEAEYYEIAIKEGGN